MALRNPKHGYGEEKNVLLTSDEYEKLKQRFPLDCDRRIESAGLYLAAKGDKYKSHYHMLLYWARMDDARKAQAKGREKRYDVEY